MPTGPGSAVGPVLLMQWTRSPEPAAAGAPKKPPMALTTGVSAKSQGHTRLARVQEEEEVMVSNERRAHSESPH